MLIDLSRPYVPHPPRRSERSRDPVRHREDVVRRLLRRGLSPATLRTILPEFRPLIERLSRDETDATRGR